MLWSGGVCLRCHAQLAAPFSQTVFQSRKPKSAGIRAFKFVILLRRAPVPGVRRFVGTKITCRGAANETSSECADRGHEKEARVSDEDHNRAPPSSSYGTSSFHLARVHEMEARVAASRRTWSEVDGTASQPAEQSGMTNREIFEVLKCRKYVRKGDEIVFEQVPEGEYARAPHHSFFCDFWNPNIEVWEKLAVGGQADIYGAGHMCFEIDWVVKVFKRGSVLQHVENQIPLASLLSFQLQNDPDKRYWSTCVGAVLLTDERLGWEERFAILMDLRWGDLRMLIDQQLMQTSHHQGPPFPDATQLLGLMFQIASQVNELHSQRPPILHKDLKAANVLVERHELTYEPDVKESGGYMVGVADYERSVGVEGTGLWRASEILHQLEHRVAGSPLVFTEKCDVYSYGMVCYEIVTGRIPFEGCSPDQGRELVLEGRRPDLPVDMDPVVEEIIAGCWEADPSARPSFDEIEKKLIEDSDGGVSLKVGYIFRQA